MGETFYTLLRKARLCSSRATVGSLTTCDESGQLCCWDVLSGTRLRHLRLQGAGPFVAMARQPAVLFPRSDGSIVLCNVVDGKARSIVVRHRAMPITMAVSACERYLAVAYPGREVLIWDIGTGTQVGQWRPKSVWRSHRWPFSVPTS